MADRGLERIPAVDIDADGVFKYVLIRVSVKEGSDEQKDIVRGYGWRSITVSGRHVVRFTCLMFVLFAADIYDKAASEIEKDRVYDCECLGGGRINHNSSSRKIHIYGHSLVIPISCSYIASYTRRPVSRTIPSGTAQPGSA
ncbi:unnamed protein product [Ranitomeya imitator]|uniref:14 kDa phosphohistidine phosphatase n=1 Tax=Ranitomeya imitator TaxID=111125 RepID=A0ABN9LF97_9NEOB|nr:unnamed protein product [Ranitomeya imitator]